MCLIKEMSHAWYAQPSVHHGDFKATLAESLASETRPTLQIDIKVSLEIVQNATHLQITDDNT